MPPEFMAILSMIGTLLLMVAIFIGAYYASKAVGKRYQGSASSLPDGVELLERRILGKDQTLFVVRVAERVFLLGATPNHIEKIEELDGALFPEKVTSPEQSVSFTSVWKDVLRKNKKGSEGDWNDGTK